MALPFRKRPGVAVVEIHGVIGNQVRTHTRLRAPIRKHRREQALPGLVAGYRFPGRIGFRLGGTAPQSVEGVRKQAHSGLRAGYRAPTIYAPPPAG